MAATYRSQSPVLREPPSSKIFNRCIHIDYSIQLRMCDRIRLCIHICQLFPCDFTAEWLT